MEDNLFCNTSSGEGDILLPRRVFALSGNEEDIEQTNIYFKNIMNGPVDYDSIEVECSYGKQYQKYWRVEPGNAKVDLYNIPCEYFPLTLKVRDRYFNVSNKASTEIHVVPKSISSRCNFLCLGDSITRGAKYVEHVQDTLPNVSCFGTRTYDDGRVNTEGRGGWSWKNYFQKGDGVGRQSPFMFPAGINGLKYWGNTAFWGNVVHADPEGYDFKGFQRMARGWKDSAEPFLFHAEGYPVNPLLDDVVFDPACGEHGSFMQWSGDSWIMMSPQPQWEFSFSKYMDRYHSAFTRNGLPQKLHVVSILLGANDLNTPEDLDGYISAFQLFIDSVREYDEQIKVIINMPIIGANQDGFSGLHKTAEYYRRMLQEGSKRILETWDHDEAVQKGIFVCPMLLGLDPDFGYGTVYVDANKYCTTKVEMVNGNV